MFRAAAALRGALSGKTLVRCDIRVPKYATVDLAGHVVDEVLSRGKHLFIRIGPASVHSHLKMEGEWRVVAQKPRTPVRDYRVRAVLAAADVTALGLDLGVLEVLDRARDMAAVSHLGPDLLGPDWDPETAAERLTAQPDRPLAETLLDQRVMAGVGNVYCNELCFLVGRLPTSPVGAAGDPARLVARAHALLRANRDRARRTTTGDSRPGRELWVYGRRGLPCRRCGTPIRYDPDGPRVRYWCPFCQR
ncbi:DNA glycosylase/AP lyase, H2TH DNA-binding protein [Segniliparus rotundus DSM 44985]|uniref:DNA-(apurinic or apyrimidinic site) lyase n=1 Tax=Segniliparus rotundus (strain ATCC BAA-972 / CDC 1076 / CIP 108378 / DSM 44985 / JCM 13578) TaxID=640132 RepID=D6ZBC0_SEGRD|nr:DNA glycosylase/AP lyase, H2TH DNA-binding protein [Segniliparus rotundus DSM 44985]